MFRPRSIANPRQHIGDWIGGHSVLYLHPFLPASLHDAGNFSFEREATETDAAHLELSYVAARAPANPAAVTLASREFRFPPELRKLTISSHVLSLSLSYARK